MDGLNRVTENFKNLVFGIYLKKTAILIGTIGLVFIDGENRNNYLTSFEKVNNVKITSINTPPLLQVIPSSTTNDGNFEGDMYEIGYWLHKDYYGQGFCTESVKKILQYVRYKLNTKYCVLKCRKDNLASKRVAEKCLFTQLCEFEETNTMRPDWGKYVELLYGIILQ